MKPGGGTEDGLVRRRIVPAVIARRSREIAMAFTGVTIGLLTGRDLAAAIAAAVVALAVVLYFSRLRPVRRYAFQVRAITTECMDACFDGPEPTAPRLSSALSDTALAMRSVKAPPRLADAHSQFIQGLEAEAVRSAAMTDADASTGEDSISASTNSSIEAHFTRLWRSMQESV